MNLGHTPEPHSFTSVPENHSWRRCITSLTGKVPFQTPAARRMRHRAPGSLAEVTARNC